MFAKKNESGFNLVELMVVVSIIGILSSVAVPRFNTFRARAQQTEAKGGLSGVFLAAQAYMANANEFVVFKGAAKGAGIGFVLDGSRPQYHYTLDSVAVGWGAGASSIPAGGDGTTAQALANGMVDMWRINANKWLCAPYDAVSKIAGTVATKSAAATDCPETNASGAATAYAAGHVASVDDVVN